MPLWVVVEGGETFRFVSFRGGGICFETNGAKSLWPWDVVDDESSDTWRGRDVEGNEGNERASAGRSEVKTRRPKSEEAEKRRKQRVT